TPMHKASRKASPRASLIMSLSGFIRIERYDNSTRATISVAARCELVSDTFHRCDSTITDLFTHLADVNIYGARHDVDIGTPDVIEKVFPCQHFVRIEREMIEQLEFFFRKRDTFPVHFHGITRPVDC